MFSPRKNLLTTTQMLTVCLALLAGLLLSMAAGWFETQQQTGQALRADTLRLHVRADSDSVFDQTCKLAVRDALLDLTASLYSQTSTAGQARTLAARHLVDFQWTAQQTLARMGQPRPVRVSLVNMYFDTTGYDGFSLPAGRYDAVRVDIGQPDSYGQNWWCVLYPGLCTSACGSYDRPEENDLICGQYILRLRVVELWQQLTASRRDHTYLAIG